MTRGRPVGADGVKRRALLVARLEPVGAARMEGASGRRAQRRGQFAREPDAFAAQRRIGGRRRRQQRAGIGVLRAAEDLVAAADLHRAAEVHHHHLVGDVPHHREIVADEEIGEAELVLQVGEDVQHLRLDRDVERRYRLVEDQDLRLQHQRAGDRDALALAAGEHVRIAVVVLRPEARPWPSWRAPSRGAVAAGSFVLTASGSSRMEPTFWRGLSEP